MYQYTRPVSLLEDKWAIYILCNFALNDSTLYLIYIKVNEEHVFEIRSCLQPHSKLDACSFYSKWLNSESLLGILFEIAHRIFSIPMKQSL